MSVSGREPDKALRVVTACCKAPYITKPHYAFFCSKCGKYEPTLVYDREIRFIEDDSSKDIPRPRPPRRDSLDGHN